MKQKIKSRTYIKAFRTADIVNTSLKLFITVLLALYCVSMLLPFVWVLVNSVKPYDLYIENSFSFSRIFAYENYVEAVQVFKVRLLNKAGQRVAYGLLPMFVYSIIWSTSTSLLSVAATTVCAYVISKYNFRGRSFLYMLGIVVMITPIVGSLPSAMYIKKSLGIFNNMFLQVITSPSTAFSGLYFLILYGAFKRISWTYAEAVFIDGGGHFRAFATVMVPMILPTCAALFVLSFLSHWNEYTNFLIWLPSYPSLALGLYVFQYEAAIYMVGMPVVLAAFVIVMIPTIILFLCSQRLIMSKFTVGGLKG